MKVPESSPENSRILPSVVQFSDDSVQTRVSKHRSNHGLKVLSVKVKDVVIQRSQTSYSEVADLLIAEMAVENSAVEKNIRRRVYDALNVLKSAKVIRKSGKLVRWNGYMPSPRMGNVLKSRYNKPVKYLRNSIVEKRLHL